MSKPDEMGAAKAAPAKQRLISQAPPPIEHIHGRSYVVPPNAESDRPSAETRRKISEAEFGIQEADRHCYEAIRKGRNVKGVDQKRWAFEAKRWSEVLRPELKHAFTKCRDVGMPPDKLADLDRRITKLDCEWSLVSQYRDGVSSTDVAAAITRHSGMRSPKFTAARQALQAIYPNGVSAPADLLNDRLCTKVIEWLKANKPDVLPISNDTVLRAADRRRK